MNFQLSTEAWAALGCLAGVVLFSLAVLWGAWRRGMRTQPRSSPAENAEGPSLLRSWDKEDAKFAELARAAENLRTPREERDGEKQL